MRANFIKENRNVDSKNIISKIIKFIGAAFIVLSISISIYLYSSFQIVYPALVVSISGFVIGIMFVGFGEIISLLHKILYKYHVE